MVCGDNLVEKEWMGGVGARDEGVKDVEDEGFGGRGGFSRGGLGKVGGEEKEKRNCGESGGGEEAEIASVDIQVCMVLDDDFRPGSPSKRGTE